MIKPAASFFCFGCFYNDKKASLMTALSVTAFSGWAQDSNSDTLVVTANRFQQPVNTVLAPTDIVTRDDIDRWQSKDLNDVMRRLPGVDISRNGGMGQSASLYVRGTEARHVLVLIDGVPMARPGISNGVDIVRSLSHWSSGWNTSAARAPRCTAPERSAGW